MIDFTPKHHRSRQPLALTPTALRDATGAANSFEMTPIRWKEKEEKKNGEEEEEREQTLAAAVVPWSSPSALKAATAAAAAPIEQRRLEAQRHRHATVWTKDPHGGRHRPAGPRSRGIDPLSHDPKTGAPFPPPEIGFEKPSIPGRTTNFVGDAMLGVPMEMISARLSAADAREPSLLGCSSSSSRQRLLPLAAPPKKMPAMFLGSSSEDEERTSTSTTSTSSSVPLSLLDSPPKIERYGIARAREVAAELLGRRLPAKKT